jgi:SAM-dependent methyltransferase
MEWFENKTFWEELYPYIFNDERWEAAPGEVESVLHLSGVSEGAVLDLCCGPGRHACLLAGKGLSVTGVDCTPFLLDKARELASDRGVDVEWVESDMRSFVRPGSFDLAISLYSSFGYGPTAEDNRTTLRNIHDSLKPGGCLVIDLKGKETFTGGFSEVLCTDGPDGSVLFQRHHIKDDWKCIKNEWVLVKGERARTFTFDLFVYSGQELRTLLENTGFADVTLHGSFEPIPYGLQASRLIAVARKPAATTEEPVSAPVTLEEQAVPSVAKSEPALEPPPAPVSAPVEKEPEPPVTAAAQAPSKEEPKAERRFFGLGKKKVSSVPPRPWWHSLTEETDEEIAAIDALEGDLSALDEGSKRVRMLIARLHMNHHKAPRHVACIIDGIRSGQTTKGYGTRTEDKRHPKEQMWRSFIDVLSAWCMGNMSTMFYLDAESLGNVNPVERLAAPTPLKMWQVQRIIARIRVGSGLYPSAEYVPLEDHRDEYKDEVKHYDATLKTVIQDKVDGKRAKLSLAWAIDNLEPWHWNFEQNLGIILDAINGKLQTDQGFAAGHRNVRACPFRPDMKQTASTLRAFSGLYDGGGKIDGEVLSALGSAKPLKQWLAASLEKTIRMQLDLTE